MSVAYTREQQTKRRERYLPPAHDFTTLNGRDCLQCPLPESNAVHEVGQRSLLTSREASAATPVGSTMRARR